MDFGDKLIGVADLKNAGLSKRFEEEGKCKKVGGAAEAASGVQGQRSVGGTGGKGPGGKMNVGFSH